MKKRSTRHALLMSVLSLLLCVSMLVGTTFAWFTDSVTSGNNLIAAGNLDVELYYQNDTTPDWVKVDGNTNIFKESTHWEPGHTEVIKLKIVNEGSLALKYQLGVGVTSETGSVNVKGAGFKLSDYIKFGLVNGNQNFTRETAIAAVSATATPLNTAYNSVTTKLLAKDDQSTDDENIVTMVVYMPSSVGNDANHAVDADVPTINLGLRLYATQFNAESDSFDETYDENAWMDGMIVYNAADLQAALQEGGTVILGDDIDLTEAVTVPAANAVTFSLRAAPRFTVLNLNGKMICNPNGYAIENYGNLMIVGNGTFEGLGGIRSRGGYLTINGGNFYVSSQWQSGTYQHTIKAEKSIVEINGGNFDATVNGHTNAMFNASTDATITINGGTFKNVNTLANFDPYLFTYEKNGKVIINDGTFLGGWRFNGDTASTEINGGKFTISFDGQSFTANSTHTLNVYGGTFIPNTNYPNHSLADKLADVLSGSSSSVVDNGNGTFDVLPSTNVEKLNDGLFLSEDDTTYYITTAAGLTAFAAKVNAGAEYEGDTFAGKTVLLMNDIDLGGAEWDPIGNMGNSSKQFSGIFDGMDHTVSNFKITQKTTDRAGKNRSPHGFFGNVNGTVKNLTIENANLTVTDDGRYAGLLVGRMNGGLIENCHISDSNAEIDYWQIGGIVGILNSGTIRDCSIANTTIAGPAAVGAIVGIKLDSMEATIEGCTVENCAIVQKGGFGGNYDAMFAAVIGAVNAANATLTIKDCAVTDTTLKGEASSALYGHIAPGATLIVDGIQHITSANALVDAFKNGGDIILATNIAMTKAITPSKSFVLNGNGHTITMTSDWTNTYALFDSIPSGVVAEFKNVIFDGINGGAIVRSIGAEVLFDQVTVQNCAHTQTQGLLRLLGKSTIKNSTFKNNQCTMVITLNYDTDSSDQPQVIENCVFENNTCTGTAVLYYVNGSCCNITDNTFLNNKVTDGSNCATVYMGFTENNVIAFNLFSGNTVTCTGTSQRVSGGVFLGYETELVGNAFVNNTATNANNDALGNDVCVSTYYTDIDLSANYWGGSAPVENKNYFVQHKGYGYNVIISNYLTSYEN